jgi:spore germination protein GerM
MNGHRRLLGALLGVVLVVAAACSVPRDKTARIITKEPTELAVRPTTCDVEPGAIVPKAVYYVRSADDKLEARQVDVSAPGEAIQLLEALKCAPDGYTSAIPDGVQFQVRPGDSEDQLTVLLFQFNVKSLNRTARVSAFQQIVFTLTKTLHIDSVRFSVNGNPYAVPLKSTDKEPGEPVTIDDYSRETVFSTTTTTTTTTTIPPTTPPATTAGPSTAPASTAPATR